jgi:hypothetical protein
LAVRNLSPRNCPDHKADDCAEMATPLQAAKPFSGLKAGTSSRMLKT